MQNIVRGAIASTTLGHATNEVDAHIKKLIRDLKTRISASLDTIASTLEVNCEQLLCDVAVSSDKELEAFDQVKTILAEAQIEFSQWRQNMEQEAAAEVLPMQDLSGLFSDSGGETETSSGFSDDDSMPFTEDDGNTPGDEGDVFINS